MIESRQSYSKESRVQFFWPTLYIGCAFVCVYVLQFCVPKHSVSGSNEHPDITDWSHHLCILCRYWLWSAQK